MNHYIPYPAGITPPDPATWQRVNQRLLAKSLSELLHEQVAAPVMLRQEADGLTRFQLNSDHDSIQYFFAGYHRQLDYWHILPETLLRQENGIALPATDTPRFFVEMQKTFGIRSFTLAHYVEELLHTLFADAAISQKGRLSAAAMANADYQTIEHQMDGHPWIIVNKGRIGFNYEDYVRYAPEMDQPVQLLWLAAHKSRAAFHALTTINEKEFLQRELGKEKYEAFQEMLVTMGVAPEEYTMLPVHTWQWHNKLLMQYAGDLANRMLIPLGNSDDWYSPQQSIRTFFNTTHPGKHYVKTAISILSTGNIRGLSPKQMAIAPRVTTWVRSLLEEDPYLQELGLILLGEVASISYEHAAYHVIPEAPYQYKEFAGALWRESALPHLQPGERLMTMAALLYVDDEGNSLVSTLIQQSGLTAEEWLYTYLQAYLKPLLHIYYRHSLCVTPHGENIILVVKDHVPVRMVIKDFVDDIVLTEEAREQLPPELANHMITSSNKENIPLFILLGVFDSFFRYLSNIFQVHTGLSEQAFWEQVYAAVLEYQAAHPQLQTKFDKYDLFTPTFKRFYINSVRLLSNAYEERTSFAIPQKGGVLNNPLAWIREQVAVRPLKA